MTTYIPNHTIYIHLHDRRGMFRVSKYNADYIWVQVKHRPEQRFPFYRFKCLAGGYNNTGNYQDCELFLNTITEGRRSPQMWYAAGRYESLCAFEQMTEEELRRYFTTGTPY